MKVKTVQQGSQSNVNARPESYEMHEIGADQNENKKTGHSLNHPKRKKATPLANMPVSSYELAMSDHGETMKAVAQNQKEKKKRRRRPRQFG